MKRIDKNTVELSPREQRASEWFDRLLDDGYSIPQAVALIKASGHLMLSTEFLDYLAH